MPDSLGLIAPFVATLRFFRKAAEKPEAQTYTEEMEDTLTIVHHIHPVNFKMELAAMGATDAR